MSSPTNEIKDRAKLPSMPFPYLVTLLILLLFVLFRKYSGLVRHNLCGARRWVKWRVQKCAGRWAFLHRKLHLRHSLDPKVFRARGDTPRALPPLGSSVRTAPSMDQPKADLPRYGEQPYRQLARITEGDFSSTGMCKIFQD
jgi:hypothetical protein